jgi:colanic acid biosynthesis glycosyl transferase WcaI
VNILYVSQYFPPEMGAPAGRVAELSRLWVEQGHEVTVLTGFPNHPTGVVPPQYRHQLRGLTAREIYNGVQVIRTWLLPFPNRKAYERMLNYSSFCVSSALTGMFASQPDVVIASSPQLLVGLSGWWLARCKRVPFVFEVRDLWPESLAAVGVGKASSPLHRLLARIAGFLYHACDRLVVVTPAFKHHLVEHWGIMPEKIHVVEHGVDTNLFRPRIPDPSLKLKLNADGHFVVSYIGTMGLAHGLETVVDTASRLQSTAPDVLFLLIGEGAEKQRLTSLIAERGLTNIRIVGQQPRESIPDYISASDVCLVPLKRSDLFKTVLPTKMLEFMACARPVILGVDGHARTVLENADAGIFVTPEDPQALAEAITRLHADPALRETLGRNGRQNVLRHFSRRQTAALYLDVLEEMLQTQPGAVPIAA